MKIENSKPDWAVSEQQQSIGAKPLILWISQVVLFVLPVGHLHSSRYLVHPDNPS